MNKNKKIVKSAAAGLAVVMAGTACFGNIDSVSAAGHEIYYQGETTKELPVGVKITYYLDGQEISPEELAGKSGEPEAFPVGSDKGL